jgi:nucleoside-diphosphate-sugar epimerase
MRVLLIGGNGFIGSPLTRELIRAGHQVAILHRSLGTKPELSTVHHILGDRNRLSSCEREIRKFRPDAIIDLILSSADQAEEVLRVARQQDARVLAASSMDVYRAWGVLQGVEPGPLEPMPITEHSALRSQRVLYSPEALQNMQSIFSWLNERYDKIAVEETILGSSEVAGTILRLPMVYGPGDPLGRFLPIWKRIADSRSTMILSEDFAAWRGPRGYVENVSQAIAVALSDRAVGRVYNVCQEPCVSELAWQQQIARQAHWQGRFVLLRKEDMPSHLLIPGNFAQHLVASSERIRDELGYAELVSIDDAILRTLAWQASHASETKISGQQFDYEAEDRALERVS